MDTRKVLQQVSEALPRVARGIDEGVRRAERGLRVGHRAVQFFVTVSNGLRRLQDGGPEEIPPPPLPRRTPR